MPSVRLSGHGVVVIVHAPFRVERTGVATALRVVGEKGEELVDVAAVARGEAKSRLVDVLDGGPQTAFRVETDHASCAWPEGWALASDPDELSPFLLMGARDAMIWLAGPVARDKALPIEKLADEGQRVRAVADRGGDARIDLDYVEAGEPWWQRRYVVRFDDSRVLVLTAQCRATDEETVRPAIDAVEVSLVPHRLH